jgi:hypothetical protein
MKPPRMRPRGAIGMRHAVRSRRSLLKSALMLALGASAGLPATATAAAPPPRIVRQGKFFLVNGWVLTADDLRKLRLL